MDATRFVAVPLAALADRRLTLEQLRVLLALFSYTSKGSNVVYPSRQAIADLTGMHAANISTATSSLEHLGWLTKEGKGGHSKATRYTMTTPATVAERATVAEQATGTLAYSATRLPVAYSARGKEHTSELTKRTQGGASADPDGFGECWAAYPKRDGGNSRADALKAYRGRLKAGASPDELFAGVKRYADYCASKGIVGTAYVKQAATFFGTGNHWQETWDVPSAAPAANPKPKAGDMRARHGINETFNEVAGWVPA